MTINVKQKKTCAKNTCVLKYSTKSHTQNECVSILKECTCISRTGQLKMFVQQNCTSIRCMLSGTGLTS